MADLLDGCGICKALPDVQWRVVETAFWDVRLAYQQMRPGRCMTILKRHAERETEVTEAEWLDLFHLRRKLHPAVLGAFGATHLNTSILMNGAFKNRESPLWGRSHVHYWDVPRYAKPVVIGDLTFEDSEYPNLNPEEYGSFVRDIPDSVRETILKAVQQRI